MRTSEPRREGACACGECSECGKKSPSGLQTELEVSGPEDIHEREADRAADQVLATSAYPAAPTIQRFAGHSSSNRHTDVAPDSVHTALDSSGSPLEPALRQDMEQRFGHDFSRVRVHAGGAAEQSARDVDAQAYTAGHDIVFGAGRFAPETHGGRRLLVHELAHVVQQGRLAAGRGPQNIQRAPKKKPPAKEKPPPPPPPQPIRQVIYGETHLSRRAQAYRIDNPNLPDSANLLVVDYETAQTGRQIQVVENRAGIHSEAEMDQFLTNVRRRVGGPVTVHEIYSERQPCGPSDSDCEGMLRQRYPYARTTFSYGYQETEAPARESRAARTRANLAAAHARLTSSRQLEWDFPGRQPPPHVERNEPGRISTRPRRFYRVRARYVPRGDTRGAERSAVIQGGSRLAGFAIAQLIKYLGIGEEDYQKNFDAKLQLLDPEIDAQIGGHAATVLALQRSGEIAYANVTLRVTSTSGGGVPFLGPVRLDKVEVTGWYKEKTVRKELKALDYFNSSQGADVDTVFLTFSEAVSLHPELVDEALDRIETRLQAIEHDIPGAFSPDIRSTLEREHQTLTRCLAKVLSGEGVPSIDMLSVSCADIIKAPRK
jgi:hypothetical protein